MRVLVSGFRHETNTFALARASYERFERGEGGVPMKRGAGLFELCELNLPMGGAISALTQRGHAVIPSIWAEAIPSAYVTEDAYERIATEIVEAVRSSHPDGIYLDLHGAMVAEHYDDGEGELLGRVRAAIGDRVPVVASLDLHANVTERMLEHADALLAYRTYPHIDMAETGHRIARMLCELMVSNSRLHCEARRLPFLIPINAMCTLFEPARGMYERLETLERDKVTSLSFAPGFPAADFPGCGPMIWGYGTDASAVAEAVSELYELALAREHEWSVPFLLPDEAVKEAMRIAAYAKRPVVIADTQDNPGAGGESNTTGMLNALIANRATGVAVGLIQDPQAAQMAHAAGVGATIHCMLGAASGHPFEGLFAVEAVSDGRCTLEGPMMKGTTIELGPVACLKIDDIRVVVSSTTAQLIDRNLYRLVGIQPETMKILVNKSSVHFRADFEPIAEAVLVAKAPGPVKADPGDLPWTSLAEGMRVRPGGMAFTKAMRSEWTEVKGGT
ncbi:M81 family metallopeptidase [Trinickia symbiotica]|uniref:M81 family metallopeptidase n=1 Tax=Trinickia symbiotica TaxID=863227 RepID=UPI000687ECD9|nr:M81 family metallopeptidase [Trinickia symbiotica]